MQGIILKSHDRTSVDDEVRGRLRYTEHVAEDGRVLGKDASMESESLIACNQHDITVVVPELH